MPIAEPKSAIDRRGFLAACSKFGVAGTLFPGVLWAMAEGEPKKITVEMISDAAAIADVPIPVEDREMMLRNLQNATKNYEQIYALHMPNGVQPAMIFDPLTSTNMHFEQAKRPLQMSAAPAIAARHVPKDLEEIAFATVRDLAEMIRTKKVS